MTDDAQARQSAANIMDNACLPEALIKNGVDKALRGDIAQAIAQARREGFEMAKTAAHDKMLTYAGGNHYDKNRAQAIASLTYPEGE
jgi:hypothetical protein